MRKVILVYLSITCSLSSAFVAAPVNAAYTIKPKVGQCFMHTQAEVLASYPKKNPINCAKMHNAETYFVAKWPLSKPPEQLPTGRGLEIATSLCHAWDKGGVLQNSDFNYWVWFTPEPPAWARGERWLRCDALRSVNQGEPNKFLSWKGLKFKAKKTLRE
jgi:hypothetical protein